MRDSLFFGGIAAISGAVSLTAMIIGVLAFYIGTSYGLYLLAKKYEPKLHPILSWIPIVNIYVYARISGKSPWWILGFLVPLLNIFVGFYLAYGIALRTKRDIGTMLLLVFFGCIMLPWLGLTVHGRKRTAAWVLGIIGIIGTLIGAFAFASSAVTAAISAGTNPRIQAEIMEELKNNPEFQKAMEELKNNPEAMEMFQEKMRNIPMFREQFDAMMKSDSETN